MPRTGLAFLAGALSITALPPFKGFVSEWLTLHTLLRSAELSSTSGRPRFALCGAGLALTAALAVTCFVKPSGRQRLDRRRLLAMVMPAVMCLLLGVLPTYAIGALDRAVQPRSRTPGRRKPLVPPFFQGSPGHNQLPRDFMGIFPSAASGWNGGLPARTLESGSCGGRSPRRSCL